MWKATSRLTLASVLRNVGPNMTFIDADQADPLPQNFVLGIAYKALQTEAYHLILTADVYKPLAHDGFFSFISGWNDDPYGWKPKEGGDGFTEFDDMDYHIGAEWMYWLSEESAFALRGGYSYDKDGKRKLPAFGLGLKYNWANFDISYFVNQENPRQQHDPLLGWICVLIQVGQMEVVSILKRAARCITAIHEPQGIGGVVCAILPCFVALFGYPAPLAAQADTWRVLAVRVSFPPEDPDGETTSGNGTFDLATETADRAYPFDAPPHDRAYFEAHLRALANYYRNVSNGQLIIEYDVYPQDPNGSYVLDTPLIEYGNGRTRREIDERVTRLFRDGIRAADDADAIDFSQYRAFAVFHAGLGGEASQKLNDIPSAFIFERDLSELADGAIAVNNGAFYVTSGMLLPEAISADGRGGLNGTLVRFFASQLGLPGLSDFENDLPALGDWCLMDTGANNQIDAARLGIQSQSGDALIGFLPSRPMAWSRMQLGWIEPLAITQNDTVEIAASGSASDLPQAVRVPISATEYFLIENRLSRLAVENRIPQIQFSTPHGVWLSADDYDAFIPGSGILIYHIDDAVIRDSNADNPINSHPDYKIADAQYRRGIALEEADGLQDIGNVSASRIIQSGIISLSNIEGAPEDAFYIGNNAVFGPDTSPNTRSNLGYESGITIEVLSPPGSAMRVAIRFANRADNWPIAGLNPTRHAPRVIDLDGDGIMEILGCSESSIAWRITGAAFEMADTCDSSFATPAVGDPSEFIFSSARARTHWRAEGAIHDLVDSPALFSAPPVIANFPEARVDIWGQSDGKIEWGHFLSASPGRAALGDSVQSLAVGNVNGDADNELIAVTRNGEVHLIHASGQSHLLAAFATPVIGSAALGDLDRDGDDDIAIVTADGVLAILDAEGPGFGDRSRTRRRAFVPCACGPRRRWLCRSPLRRRWQIVGLSLQRHFANRRRVGLAPQRRRGPPLKPRPFSRISTTTHRPTFLWARAAASSTA